MAGWSVPGVVCLREIREDPVGRRVVARHCITRKPLAVTYLSAELLVDREFRTRFSQEFPRLARVRNGRVARVHRYVERHDGAAVIGDHVHGTSLRALLLAHGALGTEAALVVFKDSLLALAAYHEAGLAHGDIKPENVVLTSAGRARLVDSGLWTSNSRRLLERSTPFYLAPEQWSGGPAAPAGDVYAATVALFECSAGAPPFYADRAPELLAKHEHATLPMDVVPEPIRDLVRSGLVKDPHGRPDADSLLAQLGAVAGRAVGSDWELRGRRELATLSAGRSTVPDVAPVGLQSADDQGRRHPVRLAAVVGGALLLAAGLASPPLAVILPGAPLFGSDGRSPVLAFPDPARDTPVRVVTNGPLADRAPSPAAQAGTGPVASARPPASLPSASDVHPASSMPELRHKGSEDVAQNESVPGKSVPASTMCTQELAFSVHEPCQGAEQPAPGSTETASNTVIPALLPVQLPAPVQLPVTALLPAPDPAPKSAPILDKIQLRKDQVRPKIHPLGRGKEVRAGRHSTTARTDHQPTEGSRSNPGWASIRSEDSAPGGPGDK